MRVEGGGVFAGAEQFRVFGKYFVADGGAVCQFTLEAVEAEFFAVDGAVVTGLFDAFHPAARAEETVEVDAGHADQGEHDGLRGDEAIDLEVEGLTFTSPSLKGGRE